MQHSMLSLTLGFKVRVSWHHPGAGADPERLFRLMRFATVHGIFKISRGSSRQQGPATTSFANNALSACLREDHPNSQKHLVRPLL